MTGPMTLSEIFAAPPAQPGREQRLAIAAITVPERLRPIDPDWVLVLAESMATIGLKEPIIVRYTASDAYELVAGAHRLAAAARLGWLDLPASIEELDDLQARLVEIEENLIRRELSKLDRAIFLAEHKRIWEELHPETKHGGTRKPLKRNGGNQVAKSATCRFTAVATERTGLSERSVQQAIALADRLSPDAIKLIRGTYLVDHESDLQWLSRLRPDQQIYAAGEVGERRAERVKDALPALGRGQRKGDEQERIYQLIAANLARASRRTREQVRDLLDQIDGREGTHITSDGGTENGEAARQTPTQNA